MDCSAGGENALLLFSIESYLADASIQLIQYEIKCDAIIRNSFQIKFKSCNISHVQNEADELGDGVTADLF